MCQVLNGDVDNAICLHAFYYAIWKRFGALPERYNWQLQAPDVLFYPLRPELVESTYLLYQVTVLTGRNSVGSVLVVCCMFLLIVNFYSLCLSAGDQKSFLFARWNGYSSEP